MTGQEYDYARHSETASSIALSRGRSTTSSPASKLCLSFIGGLCAGRTDLFLTKPHTSLGRGENCDIVLDGETVSRLHCEIIQLGSVYVLHDFSRNGTFINSQRIQQTQLQDGDQLRIGHNILFVHLKSSMRTTGLKSRETTPHHLPPVIELNPHIVVKGLEEGVTQPFSEERITIGRRMDNQVVLEGDNISRNHAAIERRGGRYFVCDLESANGTLLNEERVNLAELNDGDRLRVGNFTLMVSLRDQDCVLNFKKPTK
ncbi:MAG TPA: FHA domain-containing protein [Blastocatellia bacterium]|nr:FHA domain-containing protein [Blastocatellia bacterium]HMX27023.1 FHA domain-containing protein [Blastocatellia bacterium]HMZ22476.1 FHA domain-containing protein [Blastocatellia bacterium]HNG30170.1 FHA domain-containing protein [Blastocatellia bacterium]